MTNAMYVKKFKPLNTYYLSVYLLKKLWDLVEEIINCKISYNEVVGGFKDNLFANYMTNMASFIVYKDWLQHSLPQKKISTNQPSLFLA